MRAKRLIAIGAGCICASGAAYSNQTVSYTYDAQGRLVQSQIQSASGSGVTQIYRYDAAGNRTLHQLSGSSGETPVTLSMTSTLVNVTADGAPLTVYLSGSSQSGTVIFTENGVFLGSVQVISGQAGVWLEGLPLGTHTITASYSGDATHAPQTMNFTIKVQDIRWLPAVLDLLWW